MPPTYDSKGRWKVRRREIRIIFMGGNCSDSVKDRDPHKLEAWDLPWGRSAAFLAWAYDWLWQEMSQQGDIFGGGWDTLKQPSRVLRWWRFISLQFSLEHELQERSLGTQTWVTSNSQCQMEGNPRNTNWGVPWKSPKKRFFESHNNEVTKWFREGDMKHEKAVTWHP